MSYDTGIQYSLSLELEGTLVTMLCRSRSYSRMHSDSLDCNMISVHTITVAHKHYGKAVFIV